MPYVTSVEKIDIEKGMQQGMQLNARNMLRNVDELTSTSRRIDLGQICSIPDPWPRPIYRL